MLKIKLTDESINLLDIFADQKNPRFERARIQLFEETIFETDRLCLIPYNVYDALSDIKNHSIFYTQIGPYYNTFSDLIALIIVKLKSTMLEDKTLYQILLSNGCSLKFNGNFYKNDNVWFYECN